MMYTTYSSSSIISLRTYSAFNDYSFCSIEKCPSICCSCCSFPVNSCKLVVPTNPSILYGLRQSTLIQCPPSRRFILGSSDRYCCRSSIYDVGRCCCLESRCVKQERVVGLGRKSCNEECCVKEKRGIDVDKIRGRIGMPKRDFRSNALGDVEAMLSLLSEEVVEECGVVREKKRSSPREGKAVSKPNIERFKDRKPNVVIEKLKDRQPNVVNERLKDRKPNVDSVYREGDWKNYRLESGGRVQARFEGNKRDEERESSSIDEDGRLRRRESSSSYYSLSDSGDFGSDVEVEIQQDQFVGELLTSQKKDSRKSGGVVISEATKQDWERYRDEKDQELRSSKRDDFKVGGSIQRDWRKKSEKKLTADSEETDSRYFEQSKLSQAQQSSSMIASSSKKHLNYQEQSTSDVKSFGQSNSHNQNNNRSSRHSKSSSHHEYLTQKNRENVESSSTTWRRSGQEDDLKMVGSVQDTGCEYCKTSGRNMDKRMTQSDFQGHAGPTGMSAKLTTSAESLRENRQRKHDMSLSSHQSSVEEKSKQHDQIHVVTGQTSAERKSQHYHDIIFTDAIHAESSLRETQQSEAQIRNLMEKSKTTTENQSESRRRKEEKSSISLQTSHKEENKQHDDICLGTSLVDAGRKLQHYSGIMDTDASYSQDTLKSQQQSEIRMKLLEEKTASLVAAEEVKRLRQELDGKVTKNPKSSIVPHAERGDSGVHSSDLEVNSQSCSDRRVYNEQSFLKSKVKSVEELVEKRKRIDETIVLSTLRSEVQGPATGQFSGEATISQPSVPLISQTAVQQFSGEEAKSGKLVMTSPPYQSVSSSQFQEASSSSVRNDMGKTEEAGSGSSLKHPQSRTSSSYGEVYGSKSMSGEEYNHRDALISAARMQETSTQIVGEFTEKMRLEASSSDTSTENKLEKLDLKLQDKKYMLKGSNESDFDKTDLQKQGSEHPPQVASPNPKKKKAKKLDSKRSSADSETKGSSDQMWDVKDHFVHEASEMESLESPASGSVAVVRTGKSLWSTVANVCRLRWGSHSEKQKSPGEGKTSPSGSAGGESWFSGNEADDAVDDDDGIKAEQLGLLQEATSDQLLMETPRSQSKKDIVVNMDDKLSKVDAGASSSSSVVQSSSLSGDAFVSENINLNVPRLMSLSSPSMDLSKSSVSQLRRSNAFEDIDEPENNEAPISPSSETDVIASEGTDVIASEGTDELKTKKLQRSKVVLQRYDEWEDAYRREREQRKVDEIFMREALSEAMKAADAWEVPVGAVLVQNGKIIARGYNLVEELRDSTAHAEMLCIREASNFLRTWRLSETTLYVTLEPCPMCAGAILQARISTLVWGAPNKLLGADGSWIRLFPDGVEAEQHPEESEKPAAPVHPFHPKMDIRRGILQEECADIMQQFFQLKRRKAKAKAKEKDTSSSDESGQPSCFPKPHHRSKLLHKMHNVFHPSKQQADQSSGK
ncbi:tRNA(adenine(34)) deaminase, chloroplastic-like [Chenopodium quinoa]|uniref:tRNA(adenine(34)) deaminase n=1 Tax=Chenopodium quinoa TaxID=63459 RepID=A0A803KV98_CHEQI|nr:tRNA(adenine(34)) deaminase, chloroplastic-like [Chenopodium quinoa]